MEAGTDYQKGCISGVSYLSGKYSERSRARSNFYPTFGCDNFIKYIQSKSRPLFNINTPSSNSICYLQLRNANRKDALPCSLFFPSHWAKHLLGPFNGVRVLILELKTRLKSIYRTRATWLSGIARWPQTSPRGMCAFERAVEPPDTALHPHSPCFQFNWLLKTLTAVNSQQARAMKFNSRRGSTSLSPFATSPCPGMPRPGNDWPIQYATVLAHVWSLFRCSC